MLMDCQALHEHLPGFLEDTLQEPLWEEVRSHLEECLVCRRLSLSKNSFASDFKKLNAVPWPAHLAALFARQAQGPRKIRHAFLRPVLKTSVYLTAGLLLANCALWAVPKVTRRVHAFFLKPQALQNAEPEALRELKSIARKLGTGETFSHPGAIRGGVSLKPLHLHLSFDSEDAKNSLMEQVSGLRPDISFRAPSFWVISLSHDPLARFIDLIKLHKDTRIEGAFLDKDQLPDFEGEVRVSLFLNVPSELSPLAVSQHWHFSFHLPNRYNLLEKLQTPSVHLVYQAPEVWIFEVPGSKLKNFIETAREFPGLKADFGKNEGMPPDTDDLLARIFIYLS